MAQLSTTQLFSDANLTAYYKLEDVTDSKGSNNLTNNNSVTFTTAKYNNGANLGTSNTNKYLSTANLLSVAGGACSFCFWVKILTEVSGGAAYLLFEQSDKTTSFVRNHLYYYDNGGTPSLRSDRVRINTAVDSTTIYAVTLGISDLNHIAYTYDGATIRMYLNGVLIASGASSGNGASGTQNDGFYIGADSVGGQNASAIIDDFGIFNRALTATEVLILAKEGAGLLQNDI